MSLVEKLQLLDSELIWKTSFVRQWAYSNNKHLPINELQDEGFGS